MHHEHTSQCTDGPHLSGLVHNCVHQSLCQQLEFIIVTFWSFPWPFAKIITAMPLSSVVVLVSNLLRWTCLWGLRPLGMLEERLVCLLGAHVAAFSLDTGPRCPSRAAPCKLNLLLHIVAPWSSGRCCSWPPWLRLTGPWTRRTWGFRRCPTRMLATTTDSWTEGDDEQARGISLGRTGVDIQGAGRLAWWRAKACCSTWLETTKRDMMALGLGASR